MSWPSTSCATQHRKPQGRDLLGQFCARASSLSRTSPERQRAGSVNSTSDAGTPGATRNAPAAPFEFREPVGRRRDPLRARQRVQPGLPDEALEHFGDARDPPARPDPGFAPSLTSPRSRATLVVRQWIDVVPGGALRKSAQAEDATIIMPLRSVGTVAETDAARSPGGHDDRLPPLPGLAIAQDPAVPVADLPGQAVIDPPRLRLRLPALYRCALDLAQRVFLDEAEPLDVLQAERPYDFESHDRPADALRFAWATRAARTEARSGRPEGPSLRAAARVRPIGLTAIRTTRPDRSRDGLSCGAPALAASASLRVSFAPSA